MRKVHKKVTVLGMATLLGLWSGAANAGGVGEYGLDAPRVQTQTKAEKPTTGESNPTAGVGEYGLD